MNLFQVGDFTLASEQKSTWKIECDALTEDDWDALAVMLVERLPRSFSGVTGVPRGGEPFARALKRFAIKDIDRGPENTCLLVVDDVWTTGKSMRRFMDSLDIFYTPMRAVVFARNPVPPDVIALFQMGT
jgi:orotate phosphoribosyltransferase